MPTATAASSCRRTHASYERATTDSGMSNRGGSRAAGSVRASRRESGGNRRPAPGREHSQRQSGDSQEDGEADRALKSPHELRDQAAGGLEGRGLVDIERDSITSVGRYTVNRPWRSSR